MSEDKTGIPKDMNGTEYECLMVSTLLSGRYIFDRL